MGDDAEYYMEQQQEQTLLRRAFENAALEQNIKSLLCWSDECFEEIWEWEPLCKVVDVFSKLFAEVKVGSDFFLAKVVPIDPYEEEGDEFGYSTADDHKEIKIIDELEFNVAGDKAEASYEVIVLSQNDAALLIEEACRQKASAKNLKEEMLAEMIEEMANYMKSNSEREKFT